MVDSDYIFMQKKIANFSFTCENINNTDILKSSGFNGPLVTINGRVCRAADFYACAV